jgi:hypothetical protein
VINWFDSLPALNVSQHVWQDIQTRFEIDNKAKATATSIVAKLPEVKQVADESVNNYFGRATQILWKLKSNIDPALIEIQDVVLPQQGRTLDCFTSQCENYSDQSRQGTGGCKKFQAIQCNHYDSWF